MNCVSKRPRTVAGAFVNPRTALPMPRAARDSDVHYMASLRYSSFAMKRAFLSVLTTILIVAMTLGAMFTLVRATLWVTSIESPVQRSVGIVAELFLGVVLLLGTVWLATHLAVRIFGVKEPAPPGAPLG